ncbi:MAG TPA: bestrophin family ion channel [Gemmatimonadaceae bacterium]|nr:bestrophin family ion channel [Gemmatimonadaceae bacterium]
MRTRFALASAAAAIALFVAMILCLEVGREIGLVRTELAGPESRAGVGVVQGVSSAILALLLGFVFSGATARFDQRRQLIVQQVNAIRSAWQRVDTLAPDQQSDIRNEFRRFVDALVESYAFPASLSPAAGVTRAEEQVWSLSVAACLTPEGERARMLVLPSLTDMFAAVERERLQRRIHPPAVIYVMLVVASLITALLAGYNMANISARNWLLHVAVAAIVSLVIYVIVQVEYPRLGLVRVDAFDRALLELRATMV